MSECCPKFNPKKWDKKTLKWKDKPFIKESILTFFHIPLGSQIGKMVTKMMDLTKLAGQDVPMKDTLLLFNDPSAFKSDMYLSVKGRVPNTKNVKISGTFKTGVFDGPYTDIPKYVTKMGPAKDYYVHYAYCPGCVEKFGHNYMVIFARQ